MTTEGTDVLKSVLYTGKSASNYPTFGALPDFRVVGQENLFLMPQAKGITVRNIQQIPEYLLNNVVLRYEQQVEMGIMCRSPTDRQNLLTDINNLCKNSTYNIIIFDIQINDQGTSISPAYGYVMKIKLNN